MFKAHLTDLFAMLAISCAGIAQDEAGLPLDIGPETQLVMDPLLEEMTREAIEGRLRDTESHLVELETEEFKTQGRARDLLGMQLDRLQSIEKGFAPETIEHPPNTPPFPLSYFDDMRRQQRHFKEMQDILKQAQDASVNRIDAAEAAYEDAIQKMHALDYGGASDEEREAANLALQVPDTAFERSTELPAAGALGAR